VKCEARANTGKNEPNFSARDHAQAHAVSGAKIQKSAHPKRLTVPLLPTAISFSVLVIVHLWSGPVLQPRPSVS
jgi:hypothetical protein